MLVPLLVDKDNVGPSGLKAITNMMTMRPTPDFNVSPPPSSENPYTLTPAVPSCPYSGAEGCLW